MKPNQYPLALPVGITLDRFILKQQEGFPYAKGELSQLLRDIALAAKIVHREVNRAGLIDLYGSFGTENGHGEMQQKLDMVANIRFKRALTNGREVCAIITEEDEDIIYTGFNDAKYVVALDPLDGSSNIDVNVSIGTIFSVYRRISPIGGPATHEDFLQGGEHQVAAGYILYGTSSLLVYTTGKGVHGFTFESSLGEFILSHKQVQSPEEGAIFSYNEGNLYDFSTPITTFIERCRRRQCSARYIGSLVADVHRNLLKGGIYLYPGTQKHPDGKLRLLYECFPLAWLVEQAGGMATNGGERILNVAPRHIHQRSPLYIGSKKMVSELEQLIQYESKQQAEQVTLKGGMNQIVQKV